MEIETTEDLAETLADWVGVYGSCKSNGETGCKYDKEQPFCCRVGFTEALQERIKESVKNDLILQNLTGQKQSLENAVADDFHSSAA